jgi:hypothetical protein
MNLSADKIQQLRSMTGAGIMDCKTALTQANGDIEKAVQYLREKGIATAVKKALVCGHAERGADLQVHRLRLAAMDTGQAYQALGHYLKQAGP